MSAPIDSATSALIDAAPVWGPIVVILGCAVVAQFVIILRMSRDHRAQLVDVIAQKDAKLEEANAKLVAALQEVIPAIRDMKDMAVDMAIHAKSRRSE